jgi:hypothetical protein
MNPSKVQRDSVRELTDLPNIGKAMAADLHLIGIHSPEQLLGRDAFDLYASLCRKTATRHAPCVIDVFLSIDVVPDADRQWQKAKPVTENLKPSYRSFTDTASRCYDSPKRSNWHRVTTKSSPAAQQEINASFGYPSV